MIVRGRRNSLDLLGSLFVTVVNLKRILLTGGAGFIGSHTTLALFEAGFEVVLFDNLSTSYLSVVDRIRCVTGVQIRFIEGDILDETCLAKVLVSEKVDGVIHFAGLKSISDSLAQPLQYFNNNVVGTISLLNAMKTANVKTLVFSSSANIYGAPQYLPIDEKHPKSVDNPYGRTKLHIEAMLADLVTSEPDWRISCLRYFNPVGAHSSGSIGENSCVTSTNLMPNILKVAAGESSHLTIYGNDYETVDGTGVRDFIHVMDLAEGHMSALKFLSVNTGLHMVNLGTGRGHSVLEMVKMFESVSGLSIPCRIEARREGDVGVCYADATAARQLFGWSASRNLADMCSSAWKFKSQA